MLVPADTQALAMPRDTVFAAAHGNADNAAASSGVGALAIPAVPPTPKTAGAGTGAIAAVLPPRPPMIAPKPAAVSVGTAAAAPADAPTDALLLGVAMIVSVGVVGVPMAGVKPAAVLSTGSPDPRSPDNPPPTGTVVNPVLSVGGSSTSAFGMGGSPHFTLSCCTFCSQKVLPAFPRHVIAVKLPQVS